MITLHEYDFNNEYNSSGEGVLGDFLQRSGAELSNRKVTIYKNSFGGFFGLKKVVESNFKYFIENFSDTIHSSDFIAFVGEDSFLDEVFSMYVKSIEQHFKDFSVLALWITDRLGIALPDDYQNLNKQTIFVIGHDCTTCWKITYEDMATGSKRE